MRSLVNIEFASRSWNKGNSFNYSYWSYSKDCYICSYWEPLDLK